MEIVAYIDGGARGNPGPAGYGVRIEQPDGTLVEEFSEAIGAATNNVAEYRGLLAALAWARARGCRAVHVRSDSLLLVQQMLGNYKVKHPGLQPLYAKARLLAHELGRVTFEHVRRESNTHADRLATIRAIHAKYGVIIDPHTADGVKVGLEHREQGVPLVCLETALPAKFADTIREALGREPARPAGFGNLEQLPQRFQLIEPRDEEVKRYIAAHAS